MTTTTIDATGQYGASAQAVRGGAPQARGDRGEPPEYETSRRSRSHRGWPTKGRVPLASESTFLPRASRREHAAPSKSGAPTGIASHERVANAPGRTRLRYGGEAVATCVNP